ncbi:MAG: hypothetical protein WC091_04485 [Sulfuricellaceae bacterium]
MSGATGWLYYGSMLIFVAAMALLTPDFPRQGTLALRPAGCSLAKTAGAAPSTTESGCALEGKYDIGRSFTEISLPNGRKLLLSNTEIVGVLRK